jgi:CoA-transferase family III
VTDLLPALWADLGGAPEELDRLSVTGPPTTLTSTFPVTAAGAAAVGASLLAATAGTAARVGLDTRQLAVVLRSERYVRRDGRSLGDPFDRLSAFHRTADGWLRLHANYPWHRAAALHVLGCTEAEVPAAVAAWSGIELEKALYDAGGIGAAVRTEDVWRAETGSPPALVEHRIVGDAAARPRQRSRVLDLTRVLAGPVATRTLALHGADVLRIDAPGRPEIPLQAADTLPGKRSALLDLDRALPELERLLAGADLVVTGYRPGALDRFGLSPEALAERHPGLVVVTLSAWDHLGPWGHRRGFDSIVQAACGIALTEGDARAPGALPAQVLDHATGYLAAASALLTLARQRRDGGSHHLRLSLVGTAAWLQGNRGEPGDPAEHIDPARYLQELGPFTIARPPGTVDGRSLEWRPPVPAFGTATTVWEPR